MRPTDRRQFLIKSAAAGGAALVGSRHLRAAETGGAPIPLAPPDKQPPQLPVLEPPARKVGWAIVGLGELALERILPAFRESYLAEPVALVSGHPEKARQVAATYQISPEAIYTYETFERLAGNPKVEVIYIVLPNSLHAEFTIRGLKAGKHVFCEKPMAVAVPECEQMIAAARDAKRKLGIAYRLRYEPMNRKAVELCRQKTYGELKTIESSNCQMTLAPNIRLSHALGGGPVGDVGIYSINTCRALTGEEPIDVSAVACQPASDPRFREVPESVVFTLRFPSGVLAHCDCSFNSVESRRFRAHCTDGFIEMDPAFSYQGLRLRTKAGPSKTGSAETCELLIPEVNHFAAELDNFSDCVLHDYPIRTPGEMGLADMKVIAAIYEAIRTGQRERV